MHKLIFLSYKQNYFILFFKHIYRKKNQNVFTESWKKKTQYKNIKVCSENNSS